MRIGIMLRAYDEKGGVGVYTRNVTRHLIDSASHHQFFLYLGADGCAEELERYPNVTVRRVAVPSKIIWDQLAMPYWFWRDGLDAIFHPKFTVPLLCAGRSVMVLHGAGWFIPETKQYWSLATRLYARMMMPIYCKLAGAVAAVSHITREVFIERLGVSADKITTVYFAPGEQFNKRFTAEELDAVRAQYGLPETFLLTLSGGDRDDRKNFATVLEAFRRAHATVACKLVVAGRDCEQFRERYRIPADGYGADILFPGWVDQEELPAFYQLAAAFVYPSNMEAFPIPITEALTSGTPTITSNVFGLRELAGDAALLVDPTDSQAIADAIVALLRGPALCEELSAKARQRAQLFDWSRCANETLALIERVGRR